MDPNGPYDSCISNNKKTISDLSRHGFYALTVQISAKPFKKEPKFLLSDEPKTKASIKYTHYKPIKFKEPSFTDIIIIVANMF